MNLNREKVKQVLDVAAEAGFSGFEEQDIAHLFEDDEGSLIFYLDYLNEKGFIEGEFTPEAYAAFAVFPKPIHFIRGEITPKGRDYLAELYSQQLLATKLKQYRPSSRNFGDGRK